MKRFSLIPAAPALLIGAVLYGQSITGDLAVNVTDPSSAVVANAHLELVAVETNVKVEGMTDTLGNFLFSQLKPGHYRLDVTAPGFQKANVTDIVITLGQLVGPRRMQFGLRLSY